MLSALHMSQPKAEAEVSHVTSDRSGWLEVSKGNAKSFKKLWCQLEGSFLKCYSKQGETKEKVSTEVEGCQTVEFAEESKKQPCFKIVDKDGHATYFAGTDATVMSEWIYILGRVKNGLSPDPPEGEVVKPKPTIKRPTRPTRRPKPE